MGFPLWTLLVLVFTLQSQSYRTPSPLESNCLYRRSRCLHDTPCRLRIAEFDSICGESATECIAPSPSDCVHLLWQMKHWLGDDPCDCHPLFGAFRECNRFGHLLYDHPCETLLKKDPERDEYRSIAVTRDYGKRRTTRSPSSVQINEWKKQLSGELFSLATSTQLQSQECDVALHQICLRHVSCSQLWNLFRKNCDVDSDNACIMQQREACWESFEGLLWTGLGRCHCSSNVSDCHWIRLHTNFNKCIYEISRSSGMSMSSFSPLIQPPPPTTQRVSFVNFASQSVSTPSPIIPTTVPPATVPQYTTLLQWTTESAPIPTTTIPRAHEFPTTHQSHRIQTVQRPDDRQVTVVHSNYQHQSPSIDTRQPHPGYRSPEQSTHDPRIDDRSKIRVSYENQQTRDRYSPGNGNPTVSQSDRVSPPTNHGYPTGSSHQIDYRNPSSVQSGQDYRTQGETNQPSQPTKNTRQDHSRPGSQDHRNPTAESYRMQGGNSQNGYSQETVTTYSTQEHGRSNSQSNQQVHYRQDTNRQNQSGYRITSTTSRPDYGRSGSDYSRTQENRRREEETRQSSYRRPQQSEYNQEVNGHERNVSNANRKEERREGTSRSGGRQDYRLGQITQSNGEERGGHRVDRVRNEGREDTSDEAPQQISVVTNQERSRDEYQVSTPGVSHSHHNPTIITSSISNSRMKGIDEEKMKRKEEEERREEEEKRRRKEEEERKEREEKRKRKEEEERRVREEEMKKEEERREREREEKRERDKEEKRIKEEEDRMERERTEKIREEEEERKIEEEMRRKENERDEKRKEKERQEKVASSRKGDHSDSVSSPSSCLSALRECESVEECKFQLAELKTRCALNCDRTLCMGALRRFSSFVPLTLSMALSFCSCPNGDENCPEKELLYPPCIYDASDLPRCATVDEECRKEHKCKQLVSSMSEECPIVRGACDGGTRCTQLLLKARGSIIDTQCSCQSKDKRCLAVQSMMIPNHPCLAESRREYYRLETQESSISLKPTKNENSIDAANKKTSVVTPSRTRLTTTTEPQSRGDEVESAPWITTTTVPTTTTVYTTHAPPPAEGCSVKDSKGRSLFFHVGSVIRRNLDWSGRCSSWCECVSEEVLKCHGLPCSEEINCTSHSPHFTHQYGERLYLKERGPCMCESGEYTCALPPVEYVPELYPGIYLFLGYSKSDIEMLEKEMPSDVYQRAGFLSNKRATDIASQLQIVLESLLPHGLQCRLSVVDQFDSPGNALVRVEWHGMVKRLNQTKVSWQWGMPEKACSKYVRSLEDIFDLDESPRFQLVLSTVKQMKVHDMLDALPDSAPLHQSIYLTTLLIYLRYLL